MKQIGYFLSFLFAYFLYLPFKFLPYKACLAYGVGITKVLFPFAKKHRKIAYDNISHAFPEYTHEQRLALVKKHFEHLGRLLAGTLFASRVNKEWLDKYLVYDPESLQIEEDTKKEGVGVVLVSGHLGTWEILVQFMGVRMKGAGIYKQIRNPFVDKWVKSLREKNGIVLVTTEESNKVMKLLKDGYWIGFGSDQNAGKAGIFVNFFNRPASTYQGPALMAYLTGAKLLLYSVVCGEDGKVIVRVKNMGFIDKKKFPSREAAIRHYTELWTHLLEEEVKLFPDQYFWVHRRWRTKPGDFPGQT
ncbi:MAG TPA: lauroyl acyltransferase [Leptospiraceae bacterium]|nr:lauroyl acyltransferase [Leptospiraceae bacterium]HMW04388.1 lauroyl acyltransferase [Leptospiraceae bacterium]HMX31042.1 lauroyl acyltransferase [Leptospiraceae bacterium]HMY34136.1 lauroyl acyltransferase [Leptospiraceae bacterium]HMZ63847.1 lauroyl acyltransferase [Leptospiraceae bacterium]